MYNFPTPLSPFFKFANALSTFILQDLNRLISSKERFVFFKNNGSFQKAPIHQEIITSFLRKAIVEEPVFR